MRANVDRIEVINSFRLGKEEWCLSEAMDELIGWKQQKDNSRGG